MTTTVDGGSVRTLKIAALNDAFRSTFQGGRVLMTCGVAALGAELGMAVIARSVMHWDRKHRFQEANDPYGEHDFGRLQVGSETLFWKIDYYDKAMEFGSEDAADSNVTTRVLTIMLASEY